MKDRFFTNHTPPLAPLITVTKWGVPPHRPVLILAGTPEETREEAKQYFETYGEEELRGFQATMREDEFKALPEFEG